MVGIKTIWGEKSGTRNIQEKFPHRDERVSKYKSESYSQPGVALGFRLLIFDVSPTEHNISSTHLQLMGVMGPPPGIGTLKHRQASCHRINALNNGKIGGPGD
jgi:hypothetical protein